MCVRKERTGVSYVEMNSQISRRINWADLEHVNNYWLRADQVFYRFEED